MTTTEGCATAKSAAEGTEATANSGMQSITPRSKPPGTGNNGALEQAQQTVTIQNPDIREQPEPSRHSNDAGQQTNQIEETAKALEKEAQAKSPTEEEAGTLQEELGSAQAQAGNSDRWATGKNSTMEENDSQ